MTVRSTYGCDASSKMENEVKISELIVDLQETVQKDGDLDGVKFGSDGWIYVPSPQFDENQTDDDAHCRTAAGHTS